MMAIEDGGILGSLFTNVLPDQIDARLSKFQQLRKNRVSRIQLLSSVRAGRENEVDARISQYADGPTGCQFFCTNSPFIYRDTNFFLKQLYPQRIRNALFTITGEILCPPDRHRAALIVYRLHSYDAYADLEKSLASDI